MAVARNDGRTLLVLVLLGLCHGHAGAQDDALFRLEDLDLRDPHLFVEFIGCHDITDTELGGFAFNPALQQEIQADGDGDGKLDLSYVIEFLPLAQSEPTTLLDSGETDCTAPIEGTACRSLMPWPGAAFGSNQAAGTCLAPVADTVRPYAPAVVSPAGPCFASAPRSLVLDLAGIPVTLSDVRVAATYDQAPATRLENGLLSGFLSEADADATILPNDYPLVGGQPLSSLLPGGTGNCSSIDDRDDNGGVTGWYFYFNFSAPQVPFLLDGIFLDGFEAVSG